MFELERQDIPLESLCFFMVAEVGGMPRMLELAGKAVQLHIIYMLIQNILVILKPKEKLVQDHLLNQNSYTLLIRTGPLPPYLNSCLYNPAVFLILIPVPFVLEITQFITHFLFSLFFIRSTSPITFPYITTSYLHSIKYTFNYKGHVTIEMYISIYI